MASVVTLSVSALMEADEASAERQYDAFLAAGRQAYEATGHKVVERILLGECTFGLSDVTRLPFLVSLLRKGAAQTHAERTVLVLQEGQADTIRWIYERVRQHIPSIATAPVAFEMREA